MTPSPHIIEVYYPVTITSDDNQLVYDVGLDASATILTIPPGDYYTGRAMPHIDSSETLSDTIVGLVQSETGGSLSWLLSGNFRRNQLSPGDGESVVLDDENTTLDPELIGWRPGDETADGDAPWMHRGRLPIISPDRWESPSFTVIRDTRIADWRIFSTSEITTSHTGPKPVTRGYDHLRRMLIDWRFIPPTFAYQARADNATSRARLWTPEFADQHDGDDNAALERFWREASSEGKDLYIAVRFLGDVDNAFYKARWHAPASLRDLFDDEPGSAGEWYRAVLEFDVWRLS